MDCFSLSGFDGVDNVAVASLYPEKKRDIRILEEVGLLTDKTILAHCCHLSDGEVDHIVRKDAGIVSCPYVLYFPVDYPKPPVGTKYHYGYRFSNMLFARSVIDIPRYYSSRPRNANLQKIGLGTDIAGGPSSSLWTNIRLAIAQDRIPSYRNMASYPAPSTHPTNTAPPAWHMTHAYAYHIATVGGAATIGMTGLLGVWEVGSLFDGFLVDWNRPSEEQAFDAPVSVSTPEKVESHQQWEARVTDGWERFVMGGDDRYVHFFFLPPFPFFFSFLFHRSKTVNMVTCCKKHSRRMG